MLAKIPKLWVKRMIKIEVCVSLFVCMNGCANLSKKIFTTKSLWQDIDCGRLFNLKSIQDIAW